jgi:cyclopropane-fatty-acyl-phospholipid synthase
MRWDDAVRAASDSIITERGASFYRMWRYYLAYCAAGFTSGNIDLMQIALQRD